MYPRSGEKVERLTGKYDHNIDGKGRIIVPAKLRTELGEGFYMAPGYYEMSDGEVIPNLTLYPMDAWNRICQHLAEMPDSETGAAEAFFSVAEKCEPDSQSRIVIPTHLREYAQIEKATVVVGCNDKAKIWNADLWKKSAGITLTAANVAGMMKRLKL